MLGEDQYPTSAPSPSKGKGRQQDEAPSLTWWDFHPLAERTTSPVEWSSMNLIFTADPHQPLVVARVFPPPASSSIHTFTLPPPPPISTSSVSYLPPTVFAHTSNSLFAYFPGRTGDGLGCLWARMPAKTGRIDLWQQTQYWTVPRGDGIVAANWIGVPREYAATHDGQPARMPPLGPSIPLSTPMLLLVTQTHYVQAYFVKQQPLPGQSNTQGTIQALPKLLKRISVSLSNPNMAVETEALATSISPLDDASGGSLVCIAASIGLAYSDASIIIATRSCLHPPPPPAQAAGSELLPIDLTMTFDASPGVPEDNISWETMGEQETIEVCDVRISFDGTSLSLTTMPCRPIHLPGRLTHMDFLAAIPTPQLTKPESGQPTALPPRLYLITSCIDFGDYLSPPKSHLALTQLIRTAHLFHPTRSVWVAKPDARRTLEDGVLLFMAPFLPSSGIIRPSLVVGIANTSRPVQRTRDKTMAEIGTVSVLRLIETAAPPTAGEAGMLATKLPLSEDEDWETTPLLCPMDDTVQDLPLNAVLSTDKTMLCTSTSSAVLSKRIAIRPLPLPRPKGGALRPLSASLLCLLSANRSPANVAHLLARPTLPLELVEETLETALRMSSEGKHGGHPSRWFAEIASVAVDAYRARSRAEKSDIVRQELEERWRNMHAVCSLMACNVAFTHCKDGEAYDLDAVWQLIAVTGWFIEILEKLAKECVLIADGTGTSLPEVKPTPIPGEEDDLFSAPGTPASSVPGSGSAAPIFLLICHPFLLSMVQNMLSHVCGLRAYLQARTPSAEKAQIAKNILLDLVDCSGLDLLGIQTALGELGPELKKVDANATRRSLAMARPAPPLNGYILHAAQKLSSSSLVDKPRLFIKPDDLIDGLSRPPDMKDKERDLDVVTKAVLARPPPGQYLLKCARCGGTSQMLGNAVAPVSHDSQRWAAWERLWWLRCVCGGLWMGSAV